MANELTVTIGASYADANGVQGDVDITAINITLTTAKLLKTTQTVGITQEAVILGDIATLGFCVLVNLDPTNYIEVKVGTSGAIFAKLFPKGSADGVNFCVVHLGSGAQAPFVIAHTASCEMAIFMTPL